MAALELDDGSEDAYPVWVVVAELVKVVAAMVVVPEEVTVKQALEGLSPALETA